ncbi:hypothetical protein B566_EDAN010268 [Ephemera danica]|nr:hypothetical protein B566_EDAN010268 [Ephemera danica]
MSNKNGSVDASNPHLKKKKTTHVKRDPPPKAISWHLNLKNYYILVVIRFALALLPQNGYLHPDEFFQSVEVIAGDVFELDVFRPWEFNNSFPIRSVAMPLITVGLPYRFLKLFAGLANYWLGIDILTPYLMLVVPRVAMTCVSLVCDYCIWHMCRTFGQNYAVRLTIFASSYMVLIFGTRTFSNTIEMALLAVLLMLVLDTMRYTDEVVWREDMILDRYEAIGREHPVERARLVRLRGSLPSHSLRHCAAIAAVTVTGIFNRPTFLAFAAPALFSWLYRGMGSKTIGFSHFHLRIFALCGSGLLTAALFIIIDSGYYGYLTVAEIISMEVAIDRHFIVTPLNFILYNSKMSNLAKHGIHPRWLHAVVNLPLNFHVLGIIGIVTFCNLLRFFICGKWLRLPKAQSVTALMHATFIVPLVALSVINHQEPRFLLPLLIPLVYLHSQTLLLWHKILVPIWYTLNVLGLIFFGFIQQGGVWGLLNHLHESGLAHPAPLNSVSIISTHVYLLPRFPLLLPRPSKIMYGPGGKKYKSTRRFHIHETGSSDTFGLDVAQSILNQCAKDWKNHKLKCHVYSVYPGTLQKEFEKALDTYNISQSVDNVMFYPHINTDAMPHLWGVSCDNSCHTARSYFTRKMQELCLIMSQVRLKGTRQFDTFQY